MSARLVSSTEQGRSRNWIGYAALGVAVLTAIGQTIYAILYWI